MSIEVVSSRVDSLTKDVQRVEGTVGSIDRKLDDLGQSMLMLARLEERHSSVTEQLAKGAAVMVGVEERVANMEKIMPGLIELRGWVISCVLAATSMVILTVLKLVMF